MLSLSRVADILQGFMVLIGRWGIASYVCAAHVTRAYAL